jgi:hypothetical protein
MEQLKDVRAESKQTAKERKAVEFHEMNAQIKSPYPSDTSVVRAWIKGLYNYNFLSIDKSLA